MKIVLVKPFNLHSFSFVPPIGIGYLAAALRKQGGHEVLVYEAVRDQIATVDPFRAYLEQHRPDVVGIQVYSVDLHIVRDYLRAIKGHDPRVVTVVGGPHPAADPAGTMEYYGADLLDYAIAGEAELGLPALVDHLAGGGTPLDQVAGLAWRSGEGGCTVNAKQVVDCVDEIPWPAWDLLRPEDYPQAPLGGVAKGFPVGPIMVSRGCPLKCTFCAAKSVYGLGFRIRSVDDVIEEIKYLKQAHGVREIMIQDDNITFSKKLVLEFCEKIAPLDIPWNCSNGIRLDMVNDEVVRAMKEAGCYLVGVGIESGSQRVLDDMKKKLRLEKIRERVELISRHGIHVVGLFIIGYPTETREDILETIAFAKSLPLGSAAFANFLPLPGSPIWDELRASGQITDLDLGGMNYYQATRSFTPHLSLDELNRLLRKAVREFHLRPQIIYKVLRRSGSVSNLFHLGRRFVKNYV